MREKCEKEFTKDGDNCVKKACKDPNYKLNDKDECVMKNSKCSEEGYEIEGDMCVKRECKVGKYVIETKKCVEHHCRDYEGFIFNSTSNMCEKQVCETDKGFKMDVKTGKCMKSSCPAEYIWEEYYKRCIRRKCPEGFKFNEQTLFCEKSFCKNRFVLEMLTTGPKCVLIKTIAPPIMVDESDLSYTEAIAKATTNFGGLENQVKTDIFGCDLSLTNA